MLQCVWNATSSTYGFAWRESPELLAPLQPDSIESRQRLTQSRNPIPSASLRGPIGTLLLLWLNGTRTCEEVCAVRSYHKLCRRWEEWMLLLGRKVTCRASLMDSDHTLLPQRQSIIRPCAEVYLKLWLKHSCALEYRLPPEPQVPQISALYPTR
eukprot:6474776-Amphidinium_carterae.1